MQGASLIVAAVLATPAVVRAQPTAAELQAAGEQAAKQGEYDKAIDDFKKADRIEPKAAHACLIALAYARRNLWPQAEIFRTVCHARATASDPLPPWIATADKQIDNAIATETLAAITIDVTPGDAASIAQITVSSFAPDETFPPRMIHLPPGIHQIFATAPGYDQGHQLIEIKDKTPQHIVIELHKAGELQPAPSWAEGTPGTPPATAPSQPASPAGAVTGVHASAAPSAGPSKLPWIVGGVGVALVVAGGVYTATDVSPNWNAAHNDVDGSTQYNADEGKWQSAANVAWGLYIGGAVAVGTAVVLEYTVFKHHDEVPGVAFVPTRGGGMVSLGWAR